MNKTELIYLASPYSKGDVEENFRLVSIKAAELVKEGYVVISPITYGHTLLQFNEMPKDWNFWMNFCTEMLYRCERLLVYKMPGWESSEGVQAEISIANDHNIPIEYIDYIPSVVIEFNDTEDNITYNNLTEWTKVIKWDL